MFVDGPREQGQTRSGLSEVVRVLSERWAQAEGTHYLIIVRVSAGRPERAEWGSTPGIRRPL